MTREYLTALLSAAAAAHHAYEEKLGRPDDAWQDWYAGHMLAQMRRDFGSRIDNPLHSRAHRPRLYNNIERA
jgi:hypothetical protein